MRDLGPILYFVQGLLVLSLIFRRLEASRHAIIALQVEKRRLGKVALFCHAKSLNHIKHRTASLRKILNPGRRKSQSGPGMGAEERCKVPREASRICQYGSQGRRGSNQKGKGVSLLCSFFGKGKGVALFCTFFGTITPTLASDFAPAWVISASFPECLWPRSDQSLSHDPFGRAS